MNQLKTLGVAVAAFGMTAALVPAQAADTFSVKAGGRVQLDAALVDSDDDLLQNNSGSEFRRVRTFLKGKGFGILDYKIQYDFDQGGDNTDFADVYLRIKAGGGKLWLGNINQPFGMSEHQSSKYTNFMERSFTSQAVDIGRARSIAYSWSNNRIWWMASAFSQENDISDDNERLGVTARFAYNAMKTDTNVLHFGASAARQETGGFRGVRYRTNYHLMDDRIDQARLEEENAENFESPTQFAVEFAGAFGPVTVMAEYFNVQSDGRSGENLLIEDANENIVDSGAALGDYEFDGAYVDVMYTLGYNPAKSYSIKKGGTFGRIKGKNVWQFGARYDFGTADYDDGAIEVDTDTLTLGSTYILNPYTRFKGEVVFAETELNDQDVQEDTVFQVRAQFDF